MTAAKKTDTKRSEATHTPGPWTLSFRTVLTDVGLTLNVPVAETFLRDNREEFSEAEKEANARLIAQAPAMYEALKRLCDSIESMVGEGDIVFESVPSEVQDARAILAAIEEQS